jgi:hypothetical protein
MNHLLIFVVSLAPAALASDWPVHPNDPINAANFAGIKKGMTRTEVEKILGSRGDEGQGDAKAFPVTWQGRGRNSITLHFTYGRDGRATDFKTYFNPNVWQRVREWWGGYEISPWGGRAKRLEAAA